MADPSSMSTASGNGHMPDSGTVPHAMEVLRESVNQPLKAGDANGKAASPEQQDGVAAMQQTVDAITTTVEHADTFRQDNMAAFTKSGQIWTAGLQGMSRIMADAAQAYVDSTMSAWSAMSSAKTVKEVMELQSSLVRTSLERAMADTSKLTNFSVRLAEESMEPVTSRIRVAAETFTHPAI